METIEIIEPINEHQEFEAINQKTSERKVAEVNEIQSIQDTNRKHKAKAQAIAILKASATILALAVALGIIIGLEKIEWISLEFSIVLMAISGAFASFKLGYFWHEYKR